MGKGNRRRECGEDGLCQGMFFVNSGDGTGCQVPLPERTRSYHGQLSQCATASLGNHTPPHAWTISLKPQNDAMTYWACPHFVDRKERPPMTLPNSYFQWQR